MNRIPKGFFSNINNLSNKHSHYWMSQCYLRNIVNFCNFNYINDLKNEKNKRTFYLISSEFRENIFWIFNYFNFSWIENVPWWLHFMIERKLFLGKMIYEIVSTNIIMENIHRNNFLFSWKDFMEKKIGKYSYGNCSYEYFPYSLIASTLTLIQS